jgi:predicted TIM-barrel fold metal-dependent hydrolase
MAKKPRVIAIEEHYHDREVRSHFGEHDVIDSPWIGERLDNLSNLRIKEMDEAGIDLQVLSHGAQSLHLLDAETAVRLAPAVNDRLHETVERHPQRFAAFAALPTPDPKAAAAELERTVTKLGFKGAMVHGLTNGLFLDDKRFWPIFERAAALDVPIYLHPATTPHHAVMDAYFKDYAREFPLFYRSGWGYTIETGTQGIRLVLSGIFDKYPNLKIIMGHLGEGVPLLMWRIDSALSRGGKINFRELFCEHFWITTSGFFSNPALLCCVQELGVDRIMFSVDYPFMPNERAAKWIPTIPLSERDKTKILSGNVEKLLKL